MNLYVGTSGYSYKEWKGAFYPENLPQKRMLEFYGANFSSVEINNTFYRMPRVSVLEHWASQVPEDFRFVLKAPRRITHFQRLKDTQDSLSYFLNTAAALKHRLGPLLFQTPPNFRRYLPRLGEFLTLLPAHYHAAFEFRHQSWFDDEVFRLLREHQATLCIAQAENDLQIPRVRTADWGYLRLRRLDYTDSQLAEWADWLEQQNFNEVYVFFKHEDEGKAPQFAKRFLALVSPRFPLVHSRAEA